MNHAESQKYIRRCSKTASSCKNSGAMNVLDLQASRQFSGERAQKLASLLIQRMHHKNLTLKHLKVKSAIAASW